MIHCDPTKRHDFVFLFDVTNGNPNGDPDAGNLPRVDAETNRGIVTDVCIKRKVRDYAQGVLGRSIFIQGETALNTLYSQRLDATRDENGEPMCAPAVVRMAGDKDLKPYLEDENGEFSERLAAVEDDGFFYDPESEEVKYRGEEKKAREIMKRLSGDDEVSAELKKAIDILCKRLAESAKKAKVTREARTKAKEDMRDVYWDIRMFGAVLTGGTNAGQIRGPMQLTFATSIDPIIPRDISITRVAITKPTDMRRKSTEVGRKGYVPYGLYRLHGFYNPLLGLRYGKQVVLEQDLVDFWEALKGMFPFDRSAARGEMNSRGLYVFTHNNVKGDAPSHRLFDRVKIAARGDSTARALSDYSPGISVPAEGTLDKFPLVQLTHVIHHEEKEEREGMPTSPAS
jgi:CRISPR-associated protein Csd2